VGAELFHVDGQTDRHGDLDVSLTVRHELAVY